MSKPESQPTYGIQPQVILGASAEDGHHELDAILLCRKQTAVPRFLAVAGLEPRGSGKPPQEILLACSSLQDGMGQGRLGKLGQI